MNIKTLQRGAARVILCSVLAINTIALPAYASDQQMLTTGFEDNEDFRIFKYRTLKALNAIRDVGLTPQAILADVMGSDTIADSAQSATGAVQDYASDVGQEISDAVQQKTEAVVQDATDAATEAVKKQMNNWVDSLGESIGRALREMIDSILGGNDAE